jgi:hypothetical protein
VLPVQHLRPGGIAGGGRDVQGFRPGHDHQPLWPWRTDRSDAEGDGRAPGQPTVVDGSIAVNDSNGHSFNFTSSGTVTYTPSFDCAGAASAQTMIENNTATIGSTGQSASAAATVHCGAPSTVATALSKGVYWAWNQRQ